MRHLCAEVGCCRNARTADEHAVGDGGKVQPTPKKRGKGWWCANTEAERPCERSRELCNEVYASSGKPFCEWQQRAVCVEPLDGSEFPYCTAMLSQCMAIRRVRRAATPYPIDSHIYSSHHRPCAHSQTPDEVYFGTGTRVADELAAARLKARRKRLAANRALSCSACEPEAGCIAS